jgi:phosphatidylglycerophosphatase A
MSKTLTLLIAQGLGTGRFPILPGTVGSGLGFLWFLALLIPGNVAFFVTAIIFSFFISVIVSEEAEKILNATDPNSVVIDEIIAIPICFLGWIMVEGRLPEPMWFLTEGRWKITLGILFLFRVLDVWKPTPIRQTQKFPHGWGITIDDVLAGIYVAVITGLLLR